MSAIRSAGREPADLNIGSMAARVEVLNGIAPPDRIEVDEQVAIKALEISRRRGTSKTTPRMLSAKASRTNRRSCEAM
jgi:hypothetical protein